jgi:enoyl-CoA hydratase/carnithine racemase
VSPGFRKTEMSITLEAIDDGIAVVTLDWASKRNALGPDEADEVADLLEGLHLPKVIVLKANGPAFCAGGDLAAIAAIADQGAMAVREMVYRSFQRISRALRRSQAVTMAAVDGPAVGAGVDLAMLCDIRYVGSQGWFLQGWFALGLVPGMGGSWLIRKAAGDSVAWQFATSTERWDGQRLQKGGLAIEVQGSAFDAALEHARQVAKTDAKTISGYAALLRDDHEGFEQHLEQCAILQSELLASSNFLNMARSRLAKS